MTIDLLGNVVIVDKVSTDNLEITNGTILITEGDGVALDVAKFTRNVILTNDKFVLVDNLTKWQYIKCCLRLAWERWEKEKPYVKKCQKCKGSGYKVEQGQTNEEWFDTLTTKGKAEVIAQLSSYGGNVKAMLEWLKQPHHTRSRE
jgi:signal peptidase I